MMAESRSRPEVGEWSFPSLYNQVAQLLWKIAIAFRQKPLGSRTGVAESNRGQTRGKGAEMKDAFGKRKPSSHLAPTAA